MVGRQQITDVRSSAEGRPGTLEPRLDMRAGTIIVVVWLVTRAALACVYLPVTTLDSETYP